MPVDARAGPLRLGLSLLVVLLTATHVRGARMGRQWDDALGASRRHLASNRRARSRCGRARSSCRRPVGHRGSARVSLDAWMVEAGEREAERRGRYIPIAFARQPVATPADGRGG